MVGASKSSAILGTLAYCRPWPMRRGQGMKWVSVDLLRLLRRKEQASMGGLSCGKRSSFVSSFLTLFGAAQTLDLEAPELELSLNPCLWRLVFMVPEGAMQASKGGKQPTVLSSYDAYEPQQQPAWCHNPKCVAVVWIPWIIGLKTHSIWETMPGSKT